MAYKTTTFGFAIIVVFACVGLSNGFFWGNSKVNLFGKTNPSNGGGTNCAVCTVAVALIEQLADVENVTIDKEVEKFCNLFPSKLHDACVTLIDLYGPSIINLLELKYTPDVVCQALRFCDGQCHIFPAPKEGIKASSAAAMKVLAMSGLDGHFKDLPAICNLPGIKEICDIINNWAGNHFPIDDLDKDGFSPMPTFRGTDWRGKDCSDEDSNRYPGRKPVENDALVDSNCNGIFGVDPATGKTYEELYCANTASQGVIVLGDSASAHFHVPPQYLVAEYIATHNDTYKNILFALENEFDWPMLSATTAFYGNDSAFTPDISGPVNSSYLFLRNRNLCNHRDYQNIAVNGARSGSMNDSIQYSMSRNQNNDKPATVLYALIGNDVCNGHEDTVADMTTPEEMRANAMSTLHYLDKRLPANSSLIFVGLADGRVLYDALHNRTHPIGYLRNDVTYTDLYNYLNCLSISPCRGWMNSNATLRNITTERAQNLSAALADIAAKEHFNNFKVYYTDNPINAAIPEWVAQGGQIWQLIEPVDGFHPNQFAQPLIVDVVWKWVEQNHPELLPPINPHNADIINHFGNQGGH